VKELPFRGPGRGGGEGEDNVCSDQAPDAEASDLRLSNPELQGPWDCEGFLSTPRSALQLNETGAKKSKIREMTGREELGKGSLHFHRESAVSSQPTHPVGTRRGCVSVVPRAGCGLAARTAGSWCTRCVAVVGGAHPGRA
jgi:hypothetical protein